MTPTQPEWWQVLIAAGGVVSAFLTAYAGIKRRVDRNLDAARAEHLEAQTMQVRSSTVSAELERVSAQLEMAWERNETLAEMVEELQEQAEVERVDRRVRDALLMVHAAWDHNVLHVLRRVVQMARSAGLHVEVDDDDMQPPPPLRPPH